MKIPVEKRKRNALVFAMLTVLSFCAIFFLAALGTFTIWISTGATAYFLFMAIWSLIPFHRKRITRKKLNPRQVADQAYIKFHLWMLLNLFLAAILLLIVFWFFFT